MNKSVMVKISFRIACTVIGIVDYMTNGLLLAAGYWRQVIDGREVRFLLLKSFAWMGLYGAVWSFDAINASPSIKRRSPSEGQPALNHR
ncbi:hypothetical protein P0C22_10680 [Plesiomonas shigelloides]|uniref:hypothetical protein n=1 Tax=Plesiomonas shigelloides TaxID=703 RepID=UPI0030BDD536